ncbi:tryptophan 7-halogenase [Pseudomonas sp. R1-1]|uniref:NAD(P)/FAD-dependent oxidoreductase n=1 Tax=Pseudomonas sp. R1-1 TaxID=1602529 RepID=UPI003DA9FD4D
MNRYDVVIVGAGPAGCAAAISCARLGLHVALIEGQPFPRFRPGESLHPGIEPLFEQLGVAEQLCGPTAVRFEGHWLHWNGAPRFEAFGGDDGDKWRGFHIERAHLDATLLAQAIAIGVEIRQPCRARRVLTQSNRVIGVDTDLGSLRAQYVIDASGARGWLQRQLGLPMLRCSPPLVAHYGYSQGRGDAHTETACLQAEPDGWTWIAQVSDQTLHWTHLSFEKHSRNPSSSRVPKALRAMPTLGIARGADVSWRITRACSGAGYFLVGDAASQLDPASSHGVLKALLSGIQAAQVVADSLHRPALQMPARMQYRQWLNGWFTQDMLQLREFYRRHPHPPSWLFAD